MATAPISATPPVANSATASLKLDDLLRVMLTELTNQDPLKPVDNTDFMAQVAQFASLDSTQQLNTSISTLVTLQSVNQSVGLIGHTVTANSASGTVTGKVTALSLTGSTPTMTITKSDGSSVTGIGIGDLQQVV
jgi:flagellar basal-body rod modification protein FlgD